MVPLKGTMIKVISFFFYLSAYVRTSDPIKIFWFALLCLLADARGLKRCVPTVRYNIENLIAH